MIRKNLFLKTPGPGARPLWGGALAIIAISIITGCIVVGSPDHRTPLGDYGDAPDDQPAGYRIGPGAGIDGKFPSTYNSTNVRIPDRRGIAHTNADPSLRLGETITLETDAISPDGDADDASPLLGILNGQIGQFHIDIKARDGNPDETMAGYLNVLIDLNQDGKWELHIDQTVVVTEWVIQNYPVALPQGGEQRVDPTPAFTFGPSSVRAEMWARISLTPEPIDPAQFQVVGGWDGSGPTGGFSDGETEDVLFSCDGALRVTYPQTADVWGGRFSGFLDVVNVPAAITVENLALQPVTYAFRAKIETAFQRDPSGWFFGKTTTEYNLRLTPVGVVPAPGFPRIAPNPINLPPKRGVTIALDAAGQPGAWLTFNLQATVNVNAAAGNLAVVDDITHPGGHWDNIIGRLFFYPTAPCTIIYQQVGKHPIYMDWH